MNLSITGTQGITELNILASTKNELCLRSQCVMLSDQSSALKTYCQGGVIHSQ